MHKSLYFYLKELCQGYSLKIIEKDLIYVVYGFVSNFNDIQNLNILPDKKLRSKVALFVFWYFILINLIHVWHTHTKRS